MIEARPRRRQPRLPAAAARLLLVDRRDSGEEPV